METVKTKNTLFIFTILLMVINSSSCKMPSVNRSVQDEKKPVNVENDECAVLYSEATLTLKWDYDDEMPIEYFRLYFKAHGSPNWTSMILLTKITEAEATINHNKLGDGSWDFGVSAVVNNTESEIHSSMDHSASPETGWYIKWNYKENSNL